MATITIEIGKKNKKKVHPISFLICQGTSKKRISTDITAADSELSTNQKKIKEPTKARVIEAKRRELQDKLDSLSLELIGQDVDAAYIYERLTATHEENDFFTFADDWLEHSAIKSKKNYDCLLNSLEGYLETDEVNDEILWCVSPNYKRFSIDKKDILKIYKVTFYGRLA